MIANVRSIDLLAVQGPSSTVLRPAATLSSQRLAHLDAHVGRALHDVDAGLGQRVHLLRRRALAAGDDRAGMSHAASGRRRLAGDEPDDRLLELAA